MNDMPECSTTTEPTARKDHKCSSCGTTIQKGAEYTKITGIWNGEPNTFKLCCNCSVIFNDFKKMDPNLDYYDGPSLCQGGVSEWLQGFMYQGWHGEEAAIDIATTFGVDIKYVRSVLGINPI